MWKVKLLTRKAKVEKWKLRTRDSQNHTWRWWQGNRSSFPWRMHALKIYTWKIHSTKKFWLRIDSIVKICTSTWLYAVACKWFDVFVDVLILEWYSGSEMNKPVYKKVWCFAKPPSNLNNVYNAIMSTMPIMSTVPTMSVSTALLTIANLEHLQEEFLSHY